MKHVSTLNTKVSKDGTAKATVLTIDFTGASEEQIREYAIQAIKVKVQGRWRQDGIPDTATFVVKDNPVGAKMPAKPTVDGLAALVATMSEADREALLSRLKP